MYRRIFFALILFFLTGSLAYSEVKVNSHPYDIGQSPIVRTDYKGNLYVAYYSMDKKLYIKKNNEPETGIAVEKGEGSFIDLIFLKDDIVFIWRPKLYTAEKLIYAQRSTDGGRTFSKPVVLNTASQALTSIAVASDGKEAIYAVWVDERDKYKLYMNYSVDGGKTFLEKDINLTPEFDFVANPSLVVDGGNIHLFFMGKRGEKGKDETSESATIFYKRSGDGGKTWSDAVKVQGITDWSPSILRAVKSGDNILVFWSGILGLEGAVSRDGKEWKKIEFKDVVQQDVNRLDVATNEKGDIFVVASWRKYGGNYAVKQNVYFLKSEDKGATWTGPQRLNKNEFDNTSSRLPSMDVGDDGIIFVAWQDYRNIRGNIFINYSKDSGKTWLDKDINIEKAEGRYNSRYPYVARYKDKYYIVWTRYTDDRMAEGDLFMEEYSLK